MLPRHARPRAPVLTLRVALCAGLAKRPTVYWKCMPWSNANE